MRSLHRSGLWKAVINQRFYPNLHVYQDLTVHFPFPVSISTVSNCLVNSEVFNVWHLIKLCVDGLVMPQDPVQSKQ